MKTTLRSRARFLGLLAALLLASPLLVAGVPAAPNAVPPITSPARMPAGPNADIHDIHDPIWIPAWWRPWMLGLVLVAAGGAAMATARLIARRGKRPLTPSERALARLDEAAPFARAGQSRLYAEAASGAVRSYIEESFGLPATHRTTDEFFDEFLEKKPPQLQPHAVKLAQFLSACDLAKFSLYGMVREDMTSLNELARAFVIATVYPTPPSAVPIVQPAIPPITQPVPARAP